MILEESSIPVDVISYSVDSVLRLKGSTHEYVVEFKVPFKNVVTVVLVYAAYETPPRSDLVYMNLVIDELSQSFEHSHAFTQLPLLPSSKDDAFIQYSRYKHYRSIKSFASPLSKLSRLSIKFNDREGAPFTDMPEHFLRFEIGTARYQDKRNNLILAQEAITAWFPCAEAGGSKTQDGICALPLSPEGMQMTMSEPACRHALRIGQTQDISHIINAFRLRCRELRRNGRMATPEWDTVHLAFKFLARDAALEDGVDASRENGR